MARRPRRPNTGRDTPAEPVSHQSAPPPQPTTARLRQTSASMCARLRGRRIYMRDVAFSCDIRMLGFGLLRSLAPFKRWCAGMFSSPMSDTPAPQTKKRAARAAPPSGTVQVLL